MTPRSTGHGNLPLLATKFAAKALPAGVNTNLPVLVVLPDALFELAMASLMSFLISASIRSISCCLALTCSANFFKSFLILAIKVVCALRSFSSSTLAFRLSSINFCLSSFCFNNVTFKACKVSVFSLMASPCCF